MLNNKKILLTGIIIDLIIMGIVCIFNILLKLSAYSITNDHMQSIALFDTYIMGHMYVFFAMVILTVVFNIRQFNQYKLTQNERTPASDKKYISENILVSFLVFMIWLVVYGMIAFF